MQSIRAWLTLQGIRGLKPGILSNLLHRYGSPEAVQSASFNDLLSEGGVTTAVAKAIVEKPDAERLSQIDQDIQSIEQGKFSILTILDPDYPPRLKMIPDPPPLLYMTGQLNQADHQAIAVVGSRRGTPAGCVFTRQLSEQLAEIGFTIVSGLARGIDAAAHEGALKSSGRTIAVLGCGVDKTYPPEHRKLRDHIETRGAVLSEFSPGTPPRGYHFPQRNRLISGLCLGVVVTEAAAKSGSLITARFASEQNREVFAIPGSLSNVMSRGPHSLIKQGAKLVEGPDDIIEELLPQLESPMCDRIKDPSPSPISESPDLEAEEQAVYDQISLEPITLEEIITQGCLSAAEVLSILLSLEMKGLIRQLPGTQYIRSSFR